PAPARVPYWRVRQPRSLTHNQGARHTFGADFCLAGLKSCGPSGDEWMRIHPERLAVDAARRRGRRPERRRWRCVRRESRFVINAETDALFDTVSEKHGHRTITVIAIR